MTMKMMPRRHTSLKKDATKAVEYVDHAELHRRGRVEILIENAEALMAEQAPVSRDDEQVLFKAMHACGYALDHLVRGRAAGRTARTLKNLHQRIQDELVNRNMGLIYDMRRRTRVAGVDTDDLMSEGLWTLYRAVVSFDPWRGFRFSTYACTSILRGFLMLTRRRQRQLEQINRLGEGRLTLQSVMADRDLDTQRKLDRLQNMLSDNRAGLTPTERFVIERRLLHDPGVKPDTLESIGEMFELSKERIRQIQVSAIDKLRGALDSDGIPDDGSARFDASPDESPALRSDHDWVTDIGSRRLRSPDLVVELIAPPLSNN